MSVYRIYVEKKPEFAVEANSLIGGIKSALGLENLTGLRVINRYDAEGLSREDFDLAAPVVFSEPAVDVTYDHLPAVQPAESALSHRGKEKIMPERYSCFSSFRAFVWQHRPRKAVLSRDSGTVLLHPFAAADLAERPLTEKSALA